jgi:hypothetical protein
MSVLRRILGILVMLAGIVGLVLAVAGLVGVWTAKPAVVSYATSTIETLQGSITTSQEVMVVTEEALAATVDSLDALAVMLTATAASVDDTTPALDEVNVMMSTNLPAILESANQSMRAAQQAAVVLDSSVRSLQMFQLAMGAVPLLSGFVEVPTEFYNPEVPLDQSLGEVAENLENLPEMFINISADLDKADDNLATIQSSLTTMSGDVVFIAGSLEEYELMITQSQTSMGNLGPILTNLQSNLPRIFDGAAIALTVFLVWLLTIQVVVLTQGWELFQGTAGRMEGGEDEVVVAQPAT